jgi:hypothetical protein
MFYMVKTWNLEFFYSSLILIPVLLGTWNLELGTWNLELPDAPFNAGSMNHADR